MKYGYSNGLGRGRGRGKKLPVVLSLIGANGVVTHDEASGVVTIEVTSPQRVADIDEGHANGPGWFTRSLTQVQAGPSALAAPALTGTIQPGGAIDVAPGAWVVAEAATSVSVAFDLEVDEGAGFAAIPGYDDQEYGAVSSLPLNDSDRGKSYRATETASGTTGTATAQSNTATVPSGVTAPLPTLVGSPINQDLDLTSSGTQTETVAGAIPGAGRYLVAVADLTSGGAADLSLEGAELFSVLPLGRTSGAGNTHVALFLADADAAGDLTVRNGNTVASLSRQVMVFDAAGLTDEGLLFASATGGENADPLSVSFPGAPEGHAALAVAVSRAGDSTDATWGGDLTNGDQQCNATFSNAAHRANVAVAPVGGAPFAVTVEYDDGASSFEAFALAAILLGAGGSVPQGAHPGHLKSPGDPGLTHRGGFGPGDHYTFATDPVHRHRMELEPGETTKRWYFKATADGGLTAADIQTATGVGTVDKNWLLSNTNTQNTANHYGLRSDKMLSTEEFAGSFSGDLHRNADGTSAWIDIRSGSITQVWAGLGESPLHPAVIGCMDPTVARENLPTLRGDDGGNPESRLAWRNGNADTLGNFAVVGFEMPTDRNGKMGLNYVGSETNILLMDMGISGGDNPLSAGSVDTYRVTAFACNFFDVHFDEPPGGGTDWAGVLGSGSQIERMTGKLFWRCAHDMNGWKDPYDVDGFAWNNGEFFQPPNSRNHNIYDESYNDDVTYLEEFNARASFSAHQGRAGFYGNVMVLCDNNAGGIFSDGDLLIDVETPYLVGATSTLEDREGETVILERGGADTGAQYFLHKVKGGQPGTLYCDPVGSDVELPQAGDIIRTADNAYRVVVEDSRIWGNYGVMDRVLIMSAGYRPGVAAGNYWNAWNGFVNPGTVRNLLVANSADPFDSVDQADKTGHTETGIGIDQGGTLFFEASVHNWANAANDLNIGGLVTADLNEVTMGGFVDLEAKGTPAPIGTETTDSAIDWMRANYRRPATEAIEMYNFGAARFNRPIIGHAPGAVAVFTPNPEQDGWRMDGLGNWDVNGVHDWPVDGDTIDLNDNFAYCYQTFRDIDLDFGAAGTGGVRMYGGLIEAATSAGTGIVQLHNAGKFRVGTGAQNAAYTVTATNGRFEIDGTIASGVSGDFSGQSQCIVYGGGSLTIAAGQTLTLTGDSAKAGFDGQGAGTATLTLQGTLTFVAGQFGFSRIREVKTGRFGFQNLGGGVTGQPIPPDVVSTVVLGGDLVVNVSGLPAGPYTLIDVDNLSGSFDSVTFTGGSGTLAVDTGSGRVTVAVD